MHFIMYVSIQTHRLVFICYISGQYCHRSVGLFCLVPTHPGIILCMRTAKERRRYNVTSSLIGWAHTQNDPCTLPEMMLTYL